jgi:hypothetical protein
VAAAQPAWGVDDVGGTQGHDLTSGGER